MNWNVSPSARGKFVIYPELGCHHSGFFTHLTGRTLNLQPAEKPLELEAWMGDRNRFAAARHPVLLWNPLTHAGPSALT